MYLGGVFNKQNSFPFHLKAKNYRKFNRQMYRVTALRIKIKIVDAYDEEGLKVDNK